MTSDERVVVRLLEPSDDRSEFRSGDVDLDRFFSRFAGQNQFRHHIGTTWIALEEEEIVGFATVAAAHLETGVLPEEVRKRLPAYPMPVLRLARLAVVERVRGRGFGRLLLRTVFGIAWRMAERTGCVGVVVDAKPGAVEFYEALGFQELRHTRGALGDRPEPLPMFLPLANIPRPDSV